MPQPSISTKFFTVIIIIIFLIILHFVHLLQPIENLLVKGLSYPVSWLSATGHSVSMFLNNFCDNQKILQENEKLTNEVLSLQNQIINLESQATNYLALKEQLDFATNTNLQTVPAKIISRITDGNQNLLIINKGSADGLVIGAVVTVNPGLVIGRLIEVNDNYSHLLLLTDSRSEISAANSKNNNLVGVLQGNFDLSLKLKLIPKNSNLNVGDFIVTSGLEPTVVPGLLLGQIIDISTDERDMFLQANIKQNIPHDWFSIVSVVLP